MSTKRFQGNHLELRYKTYFAILYVPKDVRVQINRSKFYKSTETSDLKLAQTRADALVLKWKNEIAEARFKSSDPFIAEAVELRLKLTHLPQ
jgi:hypothetical protein